MEVGHVLDTLTKETTATNPTYHLSLKEGRKKHHLLDGYCEDIISSFIFKLGEFVELLMKFHIKENSLPFPFFLKGNNPLEYKQGVLQRGVPLKECFKDIKG